MVNDKKLILNVIKKHYSFKTDAEFARFLDIKPTTLSSWYSRNAINHELIYDKCVDIDGNWLLSGQGEMLRKNNNHSVEYKTDNVSDIISTFIDKNTELSIRIGQLEAENLNLKNQLKNCSTQTFGMVANSESNIA
jgi:hypothetical protein